MGDQGVFVDYSYLGEVASGNDIQCKICDKGTLLLKKKYRMGGIVAAIGYIFLVPSVLGILFSIWIMIFSGTSMKGSDSGFGEMFGFVSAIVFFVSGLLGWLLILKKRVLQCGNCSATIAAS